jgi:predicted DCC family thiol-disulfide oxidoreductase YuxK
MDDKPVVVFDGVCNLCHYGVRFIVAHERDHLLRFAAAQSAAGRELLRQCGFDPDDLKSFVLVEDGTARVRSDAALAVAGHLRLPWRMFRILRVLPWPFRDLLYDLLARNRYRWFGKRDSCIVPTAELRSRFLE